MGEAVKTTGGTNGSATLVEEEVLSEAGREAIRSIPPSSSAGPNGGPDSAAFEAWVRSVETRLAHGGGGGGSDPPVPKHLRMTKELIDFLKYVVVMIVTIAAMGWMGHEYVSQFMTREEAQVSRRSLDSSLSDVRHGVEGNEESIDNLRTYNVRISLQLQNTSDRLEQLMEITQANTSRERARARARVAEIQAGIDERNRVLNSPRSLQRIADQVERNPLGAL